MYTAMKTLLLLIALTLSCLSLSEAKKHTVSATGRVMCRIDGTSFPVQFVKVKLLDDDGIFHDTFGTTRTSSLGYFSVSGSAGDLFGKPDPFIRVEYEYSGIYGRMEVDGLVGVNRKERTSKRKFSKTINFGQIVFSSDHCRAYVRFLEAMRNFRQRTSTPLPYSRLHVRTKVIIHGGTPYSLLSTVQIPSGYKLSTATAIHELAHTVRHSLVSVCLTVAFNLVFNKFQPLKP